MSKGWLQRRMLNGTTTHTVLSVVSILYFYNIHYSLMPLPGVAEREITPFAPLVFFSHCSIYQNLNIIADLETTLKRRYFWYLVCLL